MVDLCSLWYSAVAFLYYSRRPPCDSFRTTRIWRSGISCHDCRTMHCTRTKTQQKAAIWWMCASGGFSFNSVQYAKGFYQNTIVEMEGLYIIIIYLFINRCTTGAKKCTKLCDDLHPTIYPRAMTSCSVHCSILAVQSAARWSRTPFQFPCHCWTSTARCDVGWPCFGSDTANAGSSSIRPVSNVHTLDRRTSRTSRARIGGHPCKECCLHPGWCYPAELSTGCAETGGPKRWKNAKTIPPNYSFSIVSMLPKHDVSICATQKMRTNSG